MQAKIDFHGLRVLSLESRRAPEIAKLITTYSGKPLSAPAMREVPLRENPEAIRFSRELIAGLYDLVVFLTGAGARALLLVISQEQSCDRFIQALRLVQVAARGPKPLAVLREWNVPVAFTAPEPCTWHELLAGLHELPGGLRAKRVAVQEYGVSNSDFLAALKERGAIVTPVAVYQWALPLDVEPLRAAISEMISGSVDVALFTTSVQVVHLFQLAEKMGESTNLRDALNRMMIASIGPTTSETLANHGVHVDMEPSHPKMGILVKEAAERCAEFAVKSSPLDSKLNV
jgi:uroporphyrinogen-III synthase